MADTISFTLNGNPVDLAVNGGRSLLSVLRADLGQEWPSADGRLTGTKYGCGKGHCGACTVLVGHRAVRSCRFSVKQAEGKTITTIEGLAKNGDLHPLQQAFVDHDALQCGFCTPGMILSAYGLLAKNPEPTRAEIVQGMDDNLCRCGAHIRIVQAIEAAAQAMTGAGQ